MSEKLKLLIRLDVYPRLDCTTLPWRWALVLLTRPSSRRLHWVHPSSCYLGDGSGNIFSFQGSVISCITELLLPVMDALFLTAILLPKPFYNRIEWKVMFSSEDNNGCKTLQKQMNLFCYFAFCYLQHGSVFLHQKIFYQLKRMEPWIDRWCF